MQSQVPNRYQPSALALDRLVSRLSAFSKSGPIIEDGFSNYPPDLPADPVQLERRLTSDPDVERQLCGSVLGPPPDGEKQAWLVVATAFLVSMCVYGFGK